MRVLTQVKESENYLKLTIKKETKLKEYETKRTECFVTVGQKTESG